jgi:hypothetical protein
MVVAFPASENPDESGSPSLPEELRRRLQSGRDLVERQRDEAGEAEDRFATTLTPIDRLLGGGLERGETIEVVGRRSCGRFSLALATLAAVTRAGEAAALVDLGDHLDPQSARDAGIELERLLWLRPRHLRQALAGTEIVLGAGFTLVVLDLGTPPVPGGRGYEAAWLRLQRAALDHEAALLVGTPYRVTGTAAHAVLELPSRGHALWLGDTRRSSRGSRDELARRRGAAPPLLGGLDVRAQLARARGRLSGRTGERADAVQLALHADSLAEPLTRSKSTDPAPTASFPDSDREDARPRVASSDPGCAVAG